MTSSLLLQRSIPRWIHHHHTSIGASSQLRQQQQLALRLASASSSNYNDLRYYSSSTNYCYSSQEATKVAIVGSGPSGCYTAKYLQSAWKQRYSGGDNDDDDDDDNDSSTENANPIHIDILERLPTAYGLVRNGVAPDHPEVKNVQNDFDKLFSSKNDNDDDDNNNNSNIQYFGNVHVGTDVSLQELREMYDIVVLAYGCESDRSIHWEGVDAFKGILSAREFVNWYNGHIDFAWVGDIVQEALGKKKNKPNEKTTNTNIVVIGHGNVALDCARILVKEREELDPTDITTNSLNVIRSSGGGGNGDDDNNNLEERRRRRTVDIVGRRGHVQAAFTIKEVRELTKLPNADFVVRSDELDAGLSTEASQSELKDSRPKTRIDKLLTKQAAETVNDDDGDGAATRVNLRFLMNPIRFESDDGSTLARVVCERTELTGDAGQQKAQGTGVEEALAADLALISIGYKGLAIPGTEEWFDDASGILSNTHGLVDGPRNTQDDNDGDSSSPLAGLYVSGWLKRGPSGIIGTNIADAKDTVASILKDATAVADNSAEPNEKGSLLELLQERGVQVVDWRGYQKIDAAETDDSRKRHPDQPREKLTTRQELLQAASTD